jgi:hypothetical protein
MTYNRRKKVADKLIEAGLATEKDAFKMVTVIAKHPKIALKFFKKFNIVELEVIEELTEDDIFDILETKIDDVIRSKS